VKLVSNWSALSAGLIVFDEERNNLEETE